MHLDPGDCRENLMTATVMMIMMTLFCSGTSADSISKQVPMEYITYDYLSVARNASSNGTSTSPPSASGDDSLSVVWYLVSFGGLVTFFLLLSFSEFCCKKSGLLPSTNSNSDVEDPPSPPPYELFAPPTYDSLFRNISDRKRSFRASVYLIPVHEKSELPRESPLEFGEVIRRNPMGDGEVVTPPPPP